MKRIVSGISPSGDGSLHIGNYLGAVQQFKEIAREHECFLFVADYHALTTVQKKEQLQKNTETLILNELALLGDLTNITFFRQSDVPEHAELQTILSNVTPLGLIKRAHAYKDKLEKEMKEDDINMGLFNYPVLMASDILIYNADLVPVGKDQKQHIEITRDIAQRFNKIYGKTIRQKDGKTVKTDIFKLPDAFIKDDVAVVLGTDGKRKMSKSLGNIISIFEDEEIIKKQVMGCYTDPTRAHASDPGHIEGNMVFTYLDFFPTSPSGLRGTGGVDELKDLYRKGEVSDVEVKEYLFDCLMAYFASARIRHNELKANPNLVKDILEKGAVRARAVASQTMKEVRDAVGLVNAYSMPFTRSPLAETPLVSSGGKGEALKTGVISIDEFSKVELTVGSVTQAENVEKSQKLIRLHVDFGPAFAERCGEAKRMIFTGVRGYGYAPEDFSGKQFFFVTNLKPRKMMGEESCGMILAIDGPDGKPLFISAEGLPLGASVR